MPHLHNGQRSGGECQNLGELGGVAKLRPIPVFMGTNMGRTFLCLRVIAQPENLALGVFFLVLNVGVDPVEYRSNLPAPL